MLVIFWVKEMSAIGQTAWIWIRQLCTSYVNLSADLGNVQQPRLYRGQAATSTHFLVPGPLWRGTYVDQEGLIYATWMRLCLCWSGGVQMCYRNMPGNQFPVTKDVIMGGIIPGLLHVWSKGRIISPPLDPHSHLYPCTYSKACLSAKWEGELKFRMMSYSTTVQSNN